MSSIRSKIRIVYLIGQLGKGGSEKQLFLLLKHMDLQKFEPHVIVFNPCAEPFYKGKIIDLGLAVHEIPASITSIFKRSFYLYQIFREINPQIVHSWTVHDNPYAGLIGYLSGIPIRIGSLRNSIYYKGFQSHNKVIQYLCLHSTQTLVVNAQATVSELEKMSFPKRKIFFLQNCVESPTKKQVDLSEEPLFTNIPKNHKIIGTVGNLRSNKNHHVFINGLAKLRSTHPDILGIIIGQVIPDEKEYAEGITQQIERLNLQNNIMLAGFRDNVSDLMSHFYIFCLLSESEGSPNVILEAMAAKCPVVATSVGEIPKIIKDGENGFLVKPGDVNGFSSAVDRLLNNPEQSKQMGERGFKYVKNNYTCEEAITRLQKLYLKK